MANPIRRTTRRDPSPQQLERLAAVRSILYGRRNKRTADTLDLLRNAGYQPQWLRVRWKGGVGSYVVMRGCVLRILVSATKSGLSDPHYRKLHPLPGIVQMVEIPGKRRGYRYGWCVEIQP